MGRMVLIRKDWKVSPCRGIDSDPKADAYIEWLAHFDFKNGLRFSASVPNYSYCTRNPFKCLLGAWKFAVEKQMFFYEVEEELFCLEKKTRVVEGGSPKSENEKC